MAVVAVEGTAPRWLRLAVSMQPTGTSGRGSWLNRATAAPPPLRNGVGHSVTQLPEFTQEARDRNYRELGQHTRVAMRIVDGRRWHAGCLLTGTSQQRWRAGRNETIRE